MSPTKMLAAALMLPAAVLSAATAATIWILRERRAHKATARTGPVDGRAR